jgi:hypothetical protein
MQIAREESATCGSSAQGSEVFKLVSGVWVPFRMLKGGTIAAASRSTPCRSLAKSGGTLSGCR